MSGDAVTTRFMVSHCLSAHETVVPEGPGATRQQQYLSLRAHKLAENYVAVVVHVGLDDAAPSQRIVPSEAKTPSPV